jgi:uncharacterized protein (TIGR02246 family)
MDDIEILAAVEAIRQVKARYFRCMDTKDWDGFADQFAPDAVMDINEDIGGSPGDDAGTIRGNQAIADFVRGAIDDVLTVHHGHMPEIEITSPTTARGIWAMEDMLRWPEAASMNEMHGYGHYHETYEKTDGQWRIKTIRLARLRVDHT